MAPWGTIQHEHRATHWLGGVLAVVLAACAGDDTEAARSSDINERPRSQPTAVTIPLQRVDGCSEVESLAKTDAIDRMERELDSLLVSVLGFIASGDRCDEANRVAAQEIIRETDPEPSNLAFMGLVASDASSTNNQVAGVDEADFIKNDDRYIYAAVNGAFRIVSAWPADTTREIAHVPLEGTARKLFVVDDRAVVYVSLARSGAAVQATLNTRECTYAYDCQVASDGSATAMLVFDIADRTQPKLLRRLDFDGSLIAARRIGHTVHTVVATPPLAVPTVQYRALTIQDRCDVDETRSIIDSLRAETRERIENAVVEARAPSVREGDRSYQSDDCSSVLREETPTGAAFTTLVSLDIVDDGNPTVATVVSRPGGVYASDDALYMAVLRKSWAGDRRPDTMIHEFRIDDRPDDLRYLASGGVKGRVLNQFAMDARDGYFRVATSIGYVPDPDVHNALTVLAQRDDRLEVVGQLDGIAPGEDIRSVRFDGDRAFVVTFKKTDPLYAIDLREPKSPRILGELKIPGFSTYMHMFDATHLLSIGYDAEDQGTYAFFNGLLFQLFDISDPAKPELLHKTVLGTRGSSSAALSDHLAFTLFQNKLAVPITVCEGGGQGQPGTDLTFSGLIVYDVSLDQGIQEHGRVAHPDSSGGYDNAKCQSWWTSSTSNVQRSIFMDDFVYSIAPDVLRVQQLSDMGHDVASLPWR
jgi:uncharacterized secreted protein with C-terminal beta-propeller domain